MYPLIDDKLRHNIVKRQFVLYNIKEPKLIFKRRKEMQEAMQDAIASEPEFHRCNSENHRLVN